jgi:flavin-binding protein dodecin
MQRSELVTRWSLLQFSTKESFINKGGTHMDSSVYKVIELVGTSTVSWEDAAKNAIETAGKSLKDLRIAEVISMDLKVEDGIVTAYRTKISLSFRYQT